MVQIIDGTKVCMEPDKNEKDITFLIVGGDGYEKY